MTLTGYSGIAKKYWTAGLIRPTLPVYRGCGSAAGGDDVSQKPSRQSFDQYPHSLPPCQEIGTNLHQAKTYARCLPYETASVGNGLSTCCSRTRNDGLLGGNHPDDHVPNVRHVCGRCHLPRWPYLRRNPDDERSLSGRDPRAVWCAVRRWRSRLGRRLDQFSHRSVRSVGSCHAHH